jgi:hypothetical protein
MEATFHSKEENDQKNFCLLLHTVIKAEITKKKKEINIFKFGNFSMLLLYAHKIESTAE